MTAERQDRRHDDERLVRIEREVTQLTREIGRIRTTLGDRNTTLIFDLDARYMPREELRTVFVPRVEHEERAKQERSWRLQYPVVIFAGLTWFTNLYLLLHGAH